MSAADITISITCESLQYQIIAEVSGLLGLVELSNTDPIESNGNHIIRTISYGENYSVFIVGQPDGQTCTITSNGSGTMPAGDVRIPIECVSLNFDLNLLSTGLQENGFIFVTDSISGTSQTILASGTSTLMQVPFGSSYSVAVIHQSQGSDCRVINGVGTMGPATTTLQIQCSAGNIH